MSEAERSAAVLSLRSKTVYSGLAESADVVQWFWSAVLSGSDAERAALHAALFGSDNAHVAIREIRIMLGGDNAASLITCNSVVHVLLLPAYATQPLFRRRFDESLAARFKQRRTAALDAVAAPAPLTATLTSTTTTTSGSAVRRQSTGPASSSTVRQNMAKFEAAAAHDPAKQRSLAISRLGHDRVAVVARSLHSASTPSSPPSSPPPPKPVPRVAAPAPTPVPVAAPTPAPVATPAPAIAPPVPVALATPAVPVVDAAPAPAPVQSLTASGSPVRPPSVRPPLPLTKPPVRAEPKTFSEVLASTGSAVAKPPKPLSTSPRKSSVGAAAAADAKPDEVAAQRAAQAEAQRLEAERASERTRMLQTLSERERPIYELVVTEEDFARWLNTEMAFANTLRRHRVLSDQELQEVFPHVEALKETSASLVRAFRSAGDDVYGRVGEIFVRAFDASAQAAMYESVAAQELAATRLQQLLGSNQALADHCRQARLEVDMALTDVPSLQIKPFQRLTKYPLLFRAVLAATPATASDHAFLQQAIQVVTGVLKRVDDLRDARERREKAIQLERRIAGATASTAPGAAAAEATTAAATAASSSSSSGSAVVATAAELRNARVLLHEGEATLIDDAGSEREVHLFLFSDVIMFARTTSKFQRKVWGDKSFRMHDEILLTPACTVAESRRPNLTHAFDICTVDKRRGPRKVTLVYSTHVELLAWLYAIETAIDAIRSAKPPPPPLPPPTIAAAAAAVAASPDGGSSPTSARKAFKKPKRRESSGGAADSGRSERDASIGRLERALLDAQKTRAGLLKLAQFYAKDEASAAEVKRELAQCDAEIERVRERLARKQR